MPDKKEGSKKGSKRWLKISALVLGIIIVFSVIVSSGIFLVKELIIFLPGLVPKSNIPTYINVIKDASAETSYARSLDNNTNAANDSLFAEETISADFPKGTEGIFPYANAIFNWAKTVNQAAQKRKVASSPESPESFKLTLTNKDAIDVYNNIISDLERYKDFGDYALAKKNQDEMGWIAARIQADQILLGALSDTEISDATDNFINLAQATTYGQACYYGRSHVLFFSGIKKNDCLKKLSNSLEPVRKAA